MYWTVIYDGTQKILQVFDEVARYRAALQVGGAHGWVGLEKGEKELEVIICL